MKNPLLYLAMSQGLYRKGKLWSKKGRAELEALALGPWASRRRQELLAMLDELQPQIEEFDQAVKAQARPRPAVVWLMQQKGVGPVVGLAFVLTVGPVERFSTSRKLVSYLGLNPREVSSGGRQRLGHISKQGNQMMRGLLIEAGHMAAKCDPVLRRKYQRLKSRRGANIAKVALARQMAVLLYWKLRATSAPPPVRTPGSPESHEVEKTPSIL